MSRSGSSQKQRSKTSEARLRIATEGAALGIYEWDPKLIARPGRTTASTRSSGGPVPTGPSTKRQFVADYLHPADARHFEGALDEAMRTRGICT